MTHTPAHIIGANVRAEMARAGVSQAKLGEVLHLSQSGISTRLRGVHPFNINELYAVASHLGVSAVGLQRMPEIPAPSATADVA